MLESKKQTQIVDISDEICEAGVCSPNNSTYSNGLSITIDNAVIQVKPSTSLELLRMVWLLLPYTLQLSKTRKVGSIDIEH